MNILQVHNTYKQSGGEDVVVNKEFQLLSNRGQNVKQIFFNNESVLPTRLFYNKESEDIINKAIKQFKPDVIHVHNLFYQASPSVLYAARKYNIPLVLTLHNYRLICPNGMFLRKDSLCTICKNKTIPIGGMIYKCFKQSYSKSILLSTALAYHNILKTWQKPTKIIALTETAKSIFLNSALKINPQQIVVKANSTDDIAKNKVIHYTARKEYVFVGRFSKEKAIHILIEAFNKMPDLQLSIIGSGELENELKKTANKNILFLGKQPPSVIAQKLKTAKALLFSSIIYEGLPNTIIESFAAGTPVIASNIDNINTLVTKGFNGELFKTSNPTHLIKTIKKFESQRTQKYYDNAYATFLEKYTHDINYTHLIEIYNRVVAKLTK